MSSYVNILGIDFSKLNLRETVEMIDTKISEGCNRTFHLITVNPEIAVQIQEDPELKKISLGADLITPDGVGIVWASRLKGNPVPERVTGYDLLLEALKVGNQKGWSFYLLGSDEEVNMKASEYIIKNYPSVKIVGRHHGYFSKEEDTQITENIRISNPDILIVALGSPLADKWIYSHKNHINTKVVFGVGGSLDVITGKVKRTPEILTKIGTTGIPVIVDTDKQFSLFVSVALVKFNHELLNVNYLKNLVASPYVKQLSKDNTKGIGNKNLVLKDLGNFAVPIPPLAEQQRIVQKVESIMKLIAQMENKLKRKNILIEKIANV